MATYNYVEKDGALLDQKITAGLFTGALGTPQVDLVNGGKSFVLRTLTTSGLKAHTRGKGFNSGTIQDEKTVYTMGQDRDIEFYVDKQDVDETNNELAMANISSTFISEHVQPEIDAYRFSTLYAKAIDANKSDDTITEKNAYTSLKKGISKVRKYGPQNLIAFVSSAFMDCLERSSEFSRSITNQNVGMTALESRITSLDGVPIVEVWDDSRFKTKFDFTDGYKATADAKSINFIVVAKPALIPIVKENAVYLFAPGEHTQGDGYLYQNRLYHDLFVRKAKEDAVVVSTSPATSAPKAKPGQSGGTAGSSTASTGTGK